MAFFALPVVSAPASSSLFNPRESCHVTKGLVTALVAPEGNILKRIIVGLELGRVLELFCHLAF